MTSFSDALPSNDFVLSATQLTKSFGPVQALKDGSLRISKGEVHGLVGANGAGKSTTIKIFAGALKRSGGVLEVSGRAVDHHDERNARSLGLRFIHQDIGVVPRLTVAENIFLDSRLPSRGPLVSKRRAHAAALAALDGFVDVDPADRMDQLSLSQRGLVAIARACMGTPKLVVMDEPTVSLSMPEVDTVFNVVRHMRERGISILFVSHRLPEVLELCDRVTVMRDGRSVATHDISDMTSKSLVNLIAGEKDGVVDFSATSNATRKTDTRPPPLLRVENLRGGPVVDVNFEVGRGEVVGLAGLVGSGRTSVLEQIFGLRKSAHGTVTLGDVILRRRDTSETVGHRIAMVPEDRNALGLLLDRSIRDNTTLAHLKRFRILRALPAPSRRKERRVAMDQITSLGIRAAGDSQRVRELSGGNAQKVLVSRWLCGPPPRVLLLDEPTKGVDALGKADIYHVIRTLADQGVAVVVVSSDLEELSAICHRAVVIVEGRSITELQAPLSEQKILNACYGALDERPMQLPTTREMAGR
ncbi:MAG: sugar ABC transporter ATP-binding protein [Rhodococcus sp. (in: high G+C Gram-positive bacteria)]